MSMRMRELRGLQFGALLREIRLAAGLSQEALAERARMSSGGISVLERGARRAPHRDTVELLADALSLSGEERELFEDAARRTDSSRRRGEARAPFARIVTGNLPFALTTFVGRHRTKSFLCERVLEQRLVTLTGVGGVGKTRVAIEAGHELAEHFPQGVWFVELAAINDPKLIGQRIASTMGIATAHDDTTWIGELREAKALLVLDNCEHLLNGCAAIAKTLLERCPELHIMATSREALRTIGERLIRVDPLGEHTAIEMFLERARDAAPAVAIGSDDESLDYVRAICRRLDGIPLALELAAARVSALSLKTIAQNLDQRLRLLGHGNRASIARQQTLHALIDWSYGLLSQAEQRVFEELSIFSGGCTAETATAVCMDEGTTQVDVLNLITSLVDKSLLVADVEIDEARYVLLETSREFADEKLRERGDRERIVRRHALAFLDLAERFQRIRETLSARTWEAHASPELENWRAALEWALGRRNDTVLGARMAAALWPVWMTFALAEGREWIRRALEASDANTPRETLAGLHFAEAYMALRAGEYPVAVASARPAIEEYRSLGDPLACARAQRVAGTALVFMRRVDEGEPLLWEALEVARQLDSRLLIGNVEEAIACSRSIAGDFGGARDYFSKAMTTFAAMGNERSALSSAIGLAEAHFLIGDTEEALERAGSALAKARALDDVYLILLALHNLAGYLIALDRFVEAAILAREELELASKSGYVATAVWALEQLAIIALLQSKPGAANAAALAAAARVLGFVDARYAQLNAPNDELGRQARERAQTVLHETLAENDIARLHEAGATLTEREALAEVMAWSGSDGASHSPLRKSFE